jgi:thioredoxin-like negative regulator of GroEL
VSLDSLADKATDDLLLMAREAFWNNGLDEATSIYQQLVQREPKVVEHKGELGNVYWRQGFPEKAASIYAEIAIPMIENGKADRVENMVGFIKQYHPEKAAEIEKHLQGLSK